MLDQCSYDEFAQNADAEDEAGIFMDTETAQEYLAENPPRLEILHRAQADTDYTIAYIDGFPAAVGEEKDGGFYGFVDDGEYAANLYQQRYWYVKDNKWHGTPAPRDALIDIMEGYTLVEINDGSQEAYDRSLEEAFAD
jgi:hypothetical protein